MITLERQKKAQKTTKIKWSFEVRKIGQRKGTTI